MSELQFKDRWIVVRTWGGEDSIEIEDLYQAFKERLANDTQEEARDQREVKE